MDYGAKGPFWYFNCRLSSSDRLQATALLMTLMLSTMQHMTATDVPIHVNHRLPLRLLFTSLPVHMLLADHSLCCTTPSSSEMPTTCR